MQQRGLLAVLIVLGIVFSIIYKIDGPHQMVIELVRQNTWFLSTGLAWVSSHPLDWALAFTHFSYIWART